MPEYHRTGQLTVVGSQPEVERLQNGRFRQVYFCESANGDNTDYSNVGRILPDFGTLSDAQLTYDGISLTATAYPDMRLVSAGNEYIPSAGKHMVVLTYETITDTFVQIEDDAIDTELNGLRRVSRDLIAQVGTDYALVVGTSTISHQIDAETAVTLYLASAKITDSNSSRIVSETWLEAGILQAYKGYQKDGLLLVTFESQGTAFTPTALNASNSLTDAEHIAFTGGATAPLFRSRIINVNGFRRYVRSVLLLKDGAPLVSGSTVTSKQVWEDWQYPGVVNLSFAKGIEANSGSVIPVKADLVVKLTELSTVSATPPYSITSGAYAQISFVPTESGIAQSISKAFGTQYLAGGGLGGSNTTFLGGPVTAIAGTVSSDPTYSVWLALSGQKLKYQHDEAFVTDEGVQWYRETTLTLIGAFADYD